MAVAELAFVRNINTFAKSFLQPTFHLLSSNSEELVTFDAFQNDPFQ